jgi:hypothetical protein
MEKIRDQSDTIRKIYVYIPQSLPIIEVPEVI